VTGYRNCFKTVIGFLAMQTKVAAFTCLAEGQFLFVPENKESGVIQKVHSVFFKPIKILIRK
jgi:hypothetical protein